VISDKKSALVNSSKEAESVPEMENLEAELSESAPDDTGAAHPVSKAKESTKGRNL
jgi:hypothetical protein